MTEHDDDHVESYNKRQRPSTPTMSRSAVNNRGALRPQQCATRQREQQQHKLKLNNLKKK